MDAENTDITVAENPIEAVLKEVDKEAPITIATLAKLLQAQSSHLLGEFNKQLAKRDAIIDAQAKEIKALKSQNVALANSLDEQHQYSRRNAIRIDGIPNESDGTKETQLKLEAKVKDVLKKVMKVDLEKSDFCRMHRIGKQPSSGKPKQVILKFTNYDAKHRVMKSRKSLRLLHESGQGMHRMYINDDLTKQRAQLARLAREARKNKDIKDTWVYDGRIYLKLNSDVVKVVTTKEQLQSALE